MKCIVLCAGYATRLYPLTRDTPKPLLTVADKPIIEFILDDIQCIADIDAVYVVTNDKFAAAFEEWQKRFSYHVPIEVLNDGTTSNDDRLGAIGDFSFTIEQKKIDDDILIVAGDNIFDLDMGQFIAFAQKNSPHATIAAYDVNDLEMAKKYGLVAVDDTMRITDFQEKPAEPKSTLVSLGLYYYPKETLALLDRYIAEGNNMDQPGNYVAWLSKQDAMYAYAFDGCWFDIGDFESLEKANKHFSL